MKAYSSRHGFHHFLLESHRDFTALIGTNPELFSGDYIFRGQADAMWRLEPSLTRELRELPLDLHQALRLQQLEEFCQHLRRMPELIAPRVIARVLSQLRRAHGNSFSSHAGQLVVADVTPQDEVDVWTIGQHNGLKTPLLDWTTTFPYALFFAFYGSSAAGADSHCSIYALNESLVRRKTGELRQQGSSPSGYLDLVRPLGGERRRIHAQNGLASLIQSGNVPVETWVTESFRGTYDPVLLKFIIPRAGTEDCLDELRMQGVTPERIYPDLDGACQASNSFLRREIKVHVERAAKV